jgi:hypothetical protein
MLFYTPLCYSNGCVHGRVSIGHDMLLCSLYGNAMGTIVTLFYSILYGLHDGLHDSSYRLYYGSYTH